MKPRVPRLAVRALILTDDRLLLVNAYTDHHLELWCAPGGGVEAGQSLPDNLRREVFEETGLTIEVGALALVNEFHDPARGFHQVELFFRASVTAGEIDPAWVDPEAVVTQRRFVTRAELAEMTFKPSSLAEVAFGGEAPARYDPLEPILR
ncbi:MAG: NUDIX hydrolase [Pseudomonadota bacterium]